MLLQLDEVRFIRVPKYEELTVKTLYPQALEDERLKKFLPDDTSKTKPMDRQFFFNVLNSVYPEYVASVIKDTSKIRQDPGQNEEKKDYILIADHWYNKLMLQPLCSVSFYLK